MFPDRYGMGWFWHVGTFFGGLILTAAFVVVAVLLVRYLIVATRAAQLYLDTHTTPTKPAEPPSDAKTAPRPRTPKTPPAA